MKRIMMIMLLLVMALSTFAQSASLNISKFMSNDKSRKTDGTKELYVSGKKLAPYNLRFYHSFTLSNKNQYGALAKQMETAVKEDAKVALDKELVETNGHLYYAILTLTPDKKSGMNRYIFYKDTTLKGKGNEIIVVYMEGQATVDEIENKFKLK